jgi:coenzyme PQQ precursor peptide PqqA
VHAEYRLLSSKGDGRVPISSCRAVRFGLIFTRASTRRSTRACRDPTEDIAMAWTTPTLVEICIGLEINGYLPAEF